MNGQGELIELSCSVGLGRPALIIAALRLWRAWDVRSGSENPPLSLVQGIH